MLVLISIVILFPFEDYFFFLLVSLLVLYQSILFVLSSHYTKYIIFFNVWLRFVVVVGVVMFIRLILSCHFTQKKAGRARVYWTTAVDVVCVPCLVRLWTYISFYLTAFIHISCIYIYILNSIFLVYLIALLSSTTNA